MGVVTAFHTTHNESYSQRWHVTHSDGVRMCSLLICMNCVQVAKRHMFLCFLTFRKVLTIETTWKSKSKTLTLTQKCGNHRRARYLASLALFTRQKCARTKTQRNHTTDGFSVVFYLTIGSHIIWFLRRYHIKYFIRQNKNTSTSDWIHLRTFIAALTSIKGNIIAIERTCIISCKLNCIAAKLPRSCHSGAVAETIAAASPLTIFEIIAPAACM